MTPIRTLPRTTLDSDLGWEIIIPEITLANTGLAKVSVTPDGIYIESPDGHYDLLPFAELAELLQDADALHLDEPAAIEINRAALVDRLNGTVKQLPGVPCPPRTGQQRAASRWEMTREDSW